VEKLSFVGVITGNFTACMAAANGPQKTKRDFIFLKALLEEQHQHF